VWADGGYASRLVDFARTRLRLALTIVKRTDDATGLVVLPRRLTGEATPTWRDPTPWDQTTSAG
jgi:hypothetical protein